MSQSTNQQDVTVAMTNPQATSADLFDPEPQKDDFGGAEFWDANIDFLTNEKCSALWSSRFNHLGEAKRKGMNRRLEQEENSLRAERSAWEKTPEYQLYKLAHKQWSERETRRQSPIQNAKYRRALPGEVKKFYENVVPKGYTEEWIKKVGIPGRYKSANLFDLGSDNKDYIAAADALLTMIELTNGPPYESASVGNPNTISDLMAIIGPRGTGKTWLACALLILTGMSGVKRHGLYSIHCGDRRPIYRRAADIFTEVKSSFGSKETSQGEILQTLAEAPLLVIDEIQERIGTDFEDVVLVNLIDRRYGERLPTVLISNFKPEEFFLSVGKSVESRLQECGGIIQATWPSFRAR